MRQEALADPALRAGVIEWHFDDRGVDHPTRQPDRGRDRERHGIVVRMATLVGVGQDQVGVLHQGREPHRDLAEPVGRLLVGDAEAVVAGPRDTGKCERLSRFRPARRRIVPADRGSRAGGRRLRREARHP